MPKSSLTILGVIITSVFLPYIPPQVRLSLLLMLFTVYGKSLLLYYGMILGTAGCIITHNPDLFRSISHMMIYTIFKSPDKISNPSRPSIFISNYPETSLEYFVPGVFPKKMCVMTSLEGGSKAVHWAFPKNQIIYIKRGKNEHNSNNGQFENALKLVRDKLSKGFSVFAYVDNCHKREYGGDVSELRHGMFAFSKILKVPIIPVAIDQIYMDSIFRIRNETFRLKTGRIHVVDDIKKSMIEVRQFYKDSLQQFRAHLKDRK